ncbi:aminoacyl-tRNA hydrolase [Aquimarina sp. ERC-38]|uniref:alternative ribosome rescue aminoacyl-tRNA hydrolase ArfB n=1 Tax=Aquimarina sp. ERC-38 TaxID=2949996 RepID=UPI002246A180|nr:alternative ribosome rescue aminoacyl-tRNA hydrolase ArfB [Aquimarina sp. ERC-38]UZO81599.1 aminoacyl-tRNA hydrolase [Aquimarina sp. ERC-38]
MLLQKVLEEIKVKAVRSSGAGGQHVNKVSSKILLHFNVEASEAFTNTEKLRLQTKLASRLSNQGDLILSCSQTRSQHRNKEICTDRLIKLLQSSLQVPKVRKKTKPSKTSQLKRLQNKKTQALKKANRRSPDW